MPQPCWLTVLGLINDSVVGFNVPLDTLYTVGHFEDDFTVTYSHDPTNSVIALKENG